MGVPPPPGDWGPSLYLSRNRHPVIEWEISWRFTADYFPWSDIVYIHPLTTNWHKKTEIISLWFSSEEWGGVTQDISSLQSLQSECDYCASLRAGAPSLFLRASAFFLIYLFFGVFNLTLTFSSVNGALGRNTSFRFRPSSVEGQFIVSDMNEILSFPRKLLYQNVDYVKLTNIQIYTGKRSSEANFR